MDVKTICLVIQLIALTIQLVAVVSIVCSRKQTEKMYKEMNYNSVGETI